MREKQAGMMPQIYSAIESAVAAGTPIQYIASDLIAKGWPPAPVNEAVNAWLSAHGRLQQKTNFKEFLAKHKKRALTSVIIVVFVSIIGSGIALLRPWPTKIMVDSVFGNVPAPGGLEPYTGTPQLILITSLMTAMIFVAGSIFGTIKDYLNLKLGFYLDRKIKEESYRHLLHLPLYHQERLAKGDYVYRQNTLTNSLSDLVLESTASIAQSFIMIIAILAIMFALNPQLTLISLVLVPFLFILTRLLGPHLSKISQKLTQNNSAIASSVNESVDNAETVQAFGLEEKQVNKANGLWWSNYKLSRTGLWWVNGYLFSNGLLIIIATAGVMYFGGVAALNNEMTLGQLLVFMTYMGYMLGPVEELAHQITSRNQKKVDVSRVYEVLADHEDIEHARDGKDLMIQQGKIEFQNVSYSYNDTEVLTDFNFTIEPGQKVAIIGPSGGGKSTVLKLLPLFIEPTRGRIMIDNIDIQTVSLHDLRSQISWISQNPQLFDGTILENLSDGGIGRTLTENEVVHAISASHVNEFSDKLPMQLHSPVGEGGSGLSGGQRQRVAIARGLIKSAPIVCLDEPTAALDSKSEFNIKESIGALLQNKTVLLVTHRKALLELMDKIYVMQDGKIVPVDELGGLEQYLLSMNEMGGPVPDDSNKLQDQLDKQQRQLEQLEQEKISLQVKLELEKNQSLPENSTSQDGTIYINH